jgi:hypothetical protein
MEFRPVTKKLKDKHKQLVYGIQYVRYIMLSWLIIQLNNGIFTLIPEVLND